jgi:glycosyltransferase involved in cell wall biosynthesis
MKILVVTGIFPPDIGGPATYVPALGNELANRGHQVTVVTLSDSLQHKQSYSFRLLRIRRSIFKPWRIVLTVATLLREGRQSEVLYVNGLYIESVIANFFLRKPLVQKIVGDWAWERATSKGWVKDGFEEFQRGSHGRKVTLLKTLRSFCSRRADAVIVPSQFLARVVAGWGVSGTKTIVIYNAVESLLSSRSALPLPTRINIVTVGRLVPWKQIDHLIEALTECEKVGLVIVGDGSERERLEGIVRDRQLSDRVYFAGQRSKEETFALMAACDLFVLNSTYEGFPHVVLEAMCAGLPVVATEVGGTPELVRDGENGVLISANANGELSKTLMKLLTSSEERQRLAAGARETTQRFQRSVMIESTEALLRASAL